MECKYCNQIKKNGTTENLCDTSNGMMDIFITNHTEDGKLLIEVETRTDSVEYWDAIQVPMNYCPFCGYRF